MIIEIILFLLLLGFLLYRWITKSFDKWEKMGIPYVKPSFPHGSHNIFSEKTHFFNYFSEDYEKYKDEKFYGWFMMGKPTLAINDLDILKNIQVKDFNHFTDRQEVNVSQSLVVAGKLDKLWGMQMDNASGDNWKDIRSTFTPIFTSGKMKNMLQLIKAVSTGLMTELDKKANVGDEFELKDVFGKYSLDALASCAFGLDGQSFTDEKSLFVKNAEAIFHQGLEDLLFVVKLIPGVAKFMEYFDINVFKPKATKFFRDVILQAIREREKSKVRRNDLIDLMIDCIRDTKNEDMAVGESEEEKRSQLNHKKNRNITEMEAVASALVFLVAGYDTTGTTLSYLMYSLGKYPEIQEKLQEEVDQAFEDAGGELPDYNTIVELPYLDMLIHETLRFYNPVGFNSRSCNEDYRIPDTDITVKKGDFFSWSITGIHKDSRYWSHPDEFYPEHFSKDEKSQRHPYAFQGFGQGPRSCIGMRFALLEAKVAILLVIRRYTILPGTKTLEPLELDVKNQLGWAKGGLWAKFVEREL